MGFTEFLTKLLHQNKKGDLIDYLTLKLEQKLSIKKKSIEHAIDLIARTIAKCEIEVYKFNIKTNQLERVKNDTYYRLNVKANDNEISSTFIYNVVYKLLQEQEALIIELNKKLYLANDFHCDDSITKEKTYYDIELCDKENNSLKLKKGFKASECMFVSLGLSEINKCLSDYYNDVGNLIAIQSKKYINANLTKWQLKIPGTQPKILDSKTGQPISYDEYKTKITEGLTEEKDGIVMLADGFGLDKLSSNDKYSSEDLINLECKWEKEVAMAFNIPLDVFYGSKTDKSTGTNDFITFAIMPIIAILEDGFNSSLLTKDQIEAGNMIKINKLNIKHFDIFDCATSIDKLTSSGFSHDENRYFLGIPETGEKWAKKHYITKNYSDVTETGGDKMS